MIDFNNNVQIVKIFKKKNNLLCFTFLFDDNIYFAKLFTNNLYDDFLREKKINLYINNNNYNFNNFVKMLHYYDNIILNNNLNNYFSKDIKKFNLIIFEYFKSRPLRYYINKLSKKDFNNIILQIKNAINILNNLNIIHYDLYCQTNVLLHKNNFNKWIIKIIDFGLSYIDPDENNDYDYNILIQSIIDFNYKQTISL